MPDQIANDISGGKARVEQLINADIVKKTTEVERRLSNEELLDLNADHTSHNAMD